MQHAFVAGVNKYSLELQTQRQFHQALKHGM